MRTMSKYTEIIWIGISLYRHGYISWDFFMNQIELALAHDWPTCLNDEILAGVE